MSFHEAYFIEPLLSNGYFNPVNTIAYGALLLVGFVLVYKLVKKLGIPIDRRFLIAILPFIYFASATRALRDFIYGGLRANPPPGFLTDLGQNYAAVMQGAYQHIIGIIPIQPLASAYGWVVAYFPTPGSYLITALIATVIFLIAVFLQRKMKYPYWKVMLAVGIIIDIYVTAVLPFGFLGPLMIIIPILMGWIIVLFGFSKFLQSRKFQSRFLQNLSGTLNYKNTGILGAHMLDATATFTALTFYGYLEQHVAPRLVIGFLGPASFFLLKLVVIIPVLYYIDQYKGSSDFRNFLKVAVIILGLAPGLRDALTLLLAAPGI